MYASIVNTNLTTSSCFLTLSLMDREFVVTPERIGFILNIPHDPLAIQLVFDSISEMGKVESSSILCGFQELWPQPKIFSSYQSSAPI